MFVVDRLNSGFSLLLATAKPLNGTTTITAALRSSFHAFSVSLNTFLKSFFFKSITFQVKLSKYKRYLFLRNTITITTHNGSFKVLPWVFKLQHAKFDILLQRPCLVSESFFENFSSCLLFCKHSTFRSTT